MGDDRQREQKALLPDYTQKKDNVSCCILDKKEFI